MQLKKRGDDEKYPAEVLAVGTECDVALLTGKPAGLLRLLSNARLAASTVRAWVVGAALRTPRPGSGK